MAGLDGLRAIAVSAVIAYHLGLSWAPGGLLGVGVFFTLSGYLITDLLLAARDSGKLRLGDFWLARARRLLPALFVMLIGVSVWVWIADRSQLPIVRGQVGAAAVYISNWWQSFQHVSYFARFGPPSPLNHLWSLAVEEQFYLIWPWLLLFGVRCVKERRQPAPIRPRLAGLTIVLAVISAIEMAILYHPSFDSSRDLLRNGHARIRAAVRRCAGDDVAKPRARDEGRSPCRRRPRSRGDGRPGGDRAARVAHESVLAVALPRRDGRPVARHGAGGRGAGASDHAAGARARLGTAALDRGALLRHLPVARPGDRPDHAGPRSRGPAAAGNPAGGGDRRPGGALVALRRAADPPRGAAPSLAAGTGRRVASAGPPEGSARRGHRGGAGPCARRDRARRRHGPVARQLVVLPHQRQPGGVRRRPGERRRCIGH